MSESPQERELRIHAEWARWRKQMPLARKLLVEAMQELRMPAWSMDEIEIRHDPDVRSALRLSDRIERYLEKSP